MRLELNNVREYLFGDLHLDIYLLADVFERLCDMTLEEDGLDPAHESLPGPAYMASFKRSNETSDLLQDIDMVGPF